MTNKIAFDTLDYAKMLESGGVEHPDVHSSSLAKAIVQNIYTKDEVDKMIEATIRESDKKFRLMDKKFEKSLRELREQISALDKRMELNFKEFENRLEKVAHRTIFTTVSILGTLIVLVGAVTTCAHYFIK